MGGDGILGNRDSKESKQIGRRRKWMKRREIWLVILGVILHAVYMLSIFDIYFKTPIVHGMDLVTPRFSAPAKRLVLLVVIGGIADFWQNYVIAADGLRADKFFEPDSEGNFRAPFLRSVIKNQGRWGVSHARPPTESRPGHVAIIAGFYEDPSAVTKGWKANPVEFDSVFNRSRHTFSYGSPDIVPIFCGALPHSTWNTYPHEFEDFATDASFLDEWSFEQFKSLLNKSNEDPKLKKLLQQDNLVIFLHLLGCDSNGHAHRPFSSIYLNNVKVVDHIAERVYNLLESYYKDNRTSYIFTADHGMSDKGSHGDGHPSNTDTPLVAWGAGIRYPKPTSGEDHSDHVLRFVDEHLHDTPTPKEWGLDGIERVDVNQADIAPLMVSTLLGLPCPVNSVGSLPLGYVKLKEEEEVEAVVANTKQILNQFLRKSEIKRSHSLYFKPFKPLAEYSSMLNRIESLLSARDYKAAMQLSENLRSLALEGLHYFQTYDWLMLMTMITLGYIGWMVFLVLHVLQAYTSLVGDIYKKEEPMRQKYNTGKVQFLGCLFMGVLSILLFLEHSPPLYHAYFAMTVFLWTQIFNEYQFIKALWRHLSGRKFNYVIKLLAAAVVSVFILELLVHSFTERKLYTWCFLVVGAAASLYLYNLIPWNSGIPAFVLLTCWFLSLFTLMPAEIPDNNKLVIASGGMIILIGLAAKWVDLNADWNTYWLAICKHKKKQPRFPMLFLLQVILVGLSSVMVLLSTSHRTEKQELHTIHQLMNWSIAGLSMVLPLFSDNGLLSRLNSIFLGFAPTFLLLSIGYEAVFYGAFGLVLVAWILFENSLLYSSKVKKSSAARKNLEEHIFLENDVRYLQLSDLRIPLTFMVLFNVAFFGTGNFASIASFEISSVYRFITVFSPFLMAALLIFKLFIPFLLVICAFTAITKLLQVPRLGCYFLVILFSDVMTIHFFFLVKNTGSWMEIGNSISHFGIVSAQVVFNSGSEIANFVVSSGLLKVVWDKVWDSYGGVNLKEQQNLGLSLKWKVYEEAKINIIVFVASPICTKSHLQEAELVPSTALKDPSFEFLCSNGNSFSIDKAAITLFVSHINELLQLKNQYSRISKPLIITGHSLGGSVASLFTLWLLESLDVTAAKHPLCLTFGSPLVGDKGFQQAISEHPVWTSCFLHVAASEDPIPGLFITPHYLNNKGLSSQSIFYKPFGTFLLCCETGCSCSDNPEAVIELLKAMPLGKNSGNEERLIVDYGRIVENLESLIIFKGISQLNDFIPTSLRAGTILQLGAVGVHKSQHQDYDLDNLIKLLEELEDICFSSKRNVVDPAKKLNDIKLKMAKLEWYKKVSKAQEKGYYDCYKNKPLRRDRDVEKYKRFLTDYWQEIVAQTEKKPQTKHGYFRIRWLYAGTAYRRMVEPLDIADYYESGQKDYMTKGRSNHYIKMEQWLEEAEKQNGFSSNAKKQSVDAILTYDSCFWAHVEEARIWCKSLENADASATEKESSRKKLMKFEEYVMEQIKKFAVSSEIFLKGSSFMQWWKEYEKIIGPDHHNLPLYDFMINRKYKQYASGWCYV
ncbi:Sulfatase [Corchorus olitorius]|uniref:GPI ethanolamine phosphate transferase 1 n=1 Tax=Corchorus olitorius TaxID=93759 RepID=A0A1R3KNV2_9ROSI|nr:Sulfatase [Corchorus olitorius]